MFCSCRFLGMSGCSYTTCLPLPLARNAYWDNPPHWVCHPSLAKILTHIIHTLRMLCFLRCIMYQSELIPLPTVPSLFHLVQCLRWFYKLLQVPAYSQIDTICQWWELRKLRMAGKSSLESSECLGSVGTITPAALAPIIARDCDTIPRTV